MNDVDPRVLQAISAEIQQRFIADRLAQADVVHPFRDDGQGRRDPEVRPCRLAGRPTSRSKPRPNPARPRNGASRPGTSSRAGATNVFGPYAVEITLSNPYTFRATALANVTGLLVAIALFALALSVLVSSAMARRFTTPLRRLTEASRGAGRRRPDPAGARGRGPLGLV